MRSYVFIQCTNQCTNNNKGESIIMGEFHEGELTRIQIYMGAKI